MLCVTGRGDLTVARYMFEGRLDSRPLHDCDLTVARYMFEGHLEEGGFAQRLAENFGGFARER